MIPEALLKLSARAQNFSYSPYSGITVGAALLTKSGKTYAGCNVENASYGAAICAERAAVLKAVSEGEREFLSIAVTSNLNNFAYPCGICRQVLSEFSPEMNVILQNKQGKITVFSLSELLPYSFEL